MSTTATARCTPAEIAESIALNGIGSVSELAARSIAYWHGGARLMAASSPFHPIAAYPAAVVTAEEREDALYAAIATRDVALTDEERDQLSALICYLEREIATR